MRLRTTLVFMVFAAVVTTGTTALCAPSAAGNAGDPYPQIDNRGRDGALDNQGGPDVFCYVFGDNVPPDTASYEWIELRGDPSATWLGGLRHFNNIDDGYSRQKLYIGFSFPFYGAAYDCVRVATNGFLEFTATGLSPSNACLPSVLVPGPMIAVFWDDLHLLYGGRLDTVVIGYRSFGTYFVVEFDQIGFASTSCPNVPLKFEAILYPNGHIKLQYHSIPIPTACANSQSIGIQQAGTVGSTALNYVCNTTGIQPTSGRAIMFARAPGIPRAVTNLAGRYVTPNELLTWTDPTLDTDGNLISIDSVQVWVGAVGGGEPLATVPGGVQTYTDQSPPIGWRTYSLCAFHHGCRSAAASVIVVVGNPSYANDFEVDDGGWVRSGGTWEWGTPTVPTGGPQPHSGTRCWGTTLTGTYPANACDFLDLTLGLAVAGPSATFEFWYWVDCQGSSIIDNYDGANFKVSTDGGNSWTLVSPDVGYNAAAFDATNLCVPGEPGWSRRDSTWRHAVMPIRGFAGRTPIFRLTFGSNASTQYRGFFFDDMLIWGLHPATFLAGTVRALLTNQPVVGARVWAEGWPDTARTDSAGYYELWLDAGTYSVTFDHPHFCDTTRTEVVVVEGQQTTCDAILRRPLAQIGRTSIAFLTFPGVDVSDTFRISNNGGQCPLDFTIADTSDWLSASPASGTVNPNQWVIVTVNAQAPQIVGDYSSALMIAYNAVGTPSAVRVDLSVVAAAGERSVIPTEFACYQNYPNPFNASTEIRYDLPRAMKVQISVFNINGQEVAMLIDGMRAAGAHRVMWDGKDVSGAQVASGVYVYQIKAGSFVDSKKMVLIK
jgi:hypothetical protein